MSETKLLSPAELTLKAQSYAQQARAASRVMRNLPTSEKQSILFRLADSLEEHEADLLAANQLDLEAAAQSNLASNLLGRLKFTSAKIKTLSTGIRQIANSEDPLVGILSQTELSKDLVLREVSVPIGVLLVIFESRPDVLPQIAALAIWSGNGLILKGGKEAKNTNNLLSQLVSESIQTASQGKVPAGLVTLVPVTQNREYIASLLKCDDYIDLVIPRGSNQLVTSIKTNTKIPVLGHAAGVCHVYVHAQADLAKAIKLLIDAKLDYPTACNAVETILIDSEFKQIPELLSALKKAGIELFGGPNAVKNLKLSPAESLSEEYGDNRVTVELVSSLKQAVDHIHAHGSGHTECILSENKLAQEAFLTSVDSACVFSNTSTRFADGFRFGFGAEVGISTGRIHARGPVGVKGLTVSKWNIRALNNNAFTATEFSKGDLKWIHKPLAIPTSTDSSTDSKKEVRFNTAEQQAIQKSNGNQGISRAQVTGFVFLGLGIGALAGYFVGNGKKF